MSLNKWANRQTGKAFAKVIALHHGRTHPAYTAAKRLGRTGRRADFEAMLERCQHCFSEAEMDRLSDEVEALRDTTQAEAERIHQDNARRFVELAGGNSNGKA